MPLAPFSDHASRPPHPLIRVLHLPTRLVALILSAGILLQGCGDAAEPPSDVASPRTTEIRPRASMPAPGAMALERHPDGVSLFANGVRRSAVLSGLGEMFGFDVVSEQEHDPPVRAHAVGVSLEAALDIALADVPYIVESEVDPFDGHRRLVRLVVAPEAAEEVLTPGEGMAPSLGVERARLLRELGDATPEERSASIWMLDPEHPDELAFLLQLLAGDEDPRVRAAAATQLELAVAAEAIPALEAASSDPDRATAEAARASLERLRADRSSVPVR